MNEKELLKLLMDEIAKQKKTSSSENIKKKIEVLGRDDLIVEDLKKNFTISKNSNTVIVCTLEINDLVAISNGTYVNEYSEKIMKAILDGKKIYILEEGIGWHNFKNIPIALKIKYEEAEKALIIYGVNICKRLELNHKLSGNKKNILSGVLDLRTIKRETVYANIIEVRKSVQITDLAKEYARKKNIEIIRSNI